MRKSDLIGQRFGRLEVRGQADRDKNGQARWECVCDCGNKVVCLGSNLRAKKGSKSCGCFAKERARETMALLRETINSRTEEQLVGKKFNRLTVISFHDYDPSQSKVKRWACKCDCGKQVIARTNAIVTGSTKSCGCWRKESRMLESGVCMRNHLLATYKAAAKRRGYEWKLADEEFFFLTQQNCHYCHLPPSERKDSKRYNGGYVCNGVDRKNNEPWYTVENALTACSVCNRMKGTMTYEAFIVKCQNVAQTKYGAIGLNV